MGGINFENLALVVLFLFAVWAMGRIFRQIKLPAVLGEFLAGLLLGPNCFDIVPFASTGDCPSLKFGGDDDRRRLGGDGEDDKFAWPDGCFRNRWWKGDHIMDVWSFAGTIGVTLLIMESGMHINFKKVRVVGMRALVVAIIGTACPLVTGMALTEAFFPGKIYPDGFAAGCALAPTSVGISIKLLDDAKMLNSVAGQTTLTAAFVDDVFSLVLLVLLDALTGDVDPAFIVGITIAAFAFLGFGVLLANYVFTHLSYYLHMIPDVKAASIQPRDEVHLLMMIASLFLFSYIGSLIGSHLLGAFVAGMCWVKVPRSHQIWVAQLKRIIRWLVRIFFAATVGFAVPLEDMLTLKAFYRGLVLGAVPGILAKVLAGVPARLPYKREQDKQLAASASKATCGGRYQPLQYLVGMAMVARGEFAFLVAYNAKEMKIEDSDPTEYMMNNDVYAMVTWALVWALVFAPFGFKWALAVYQRAAPVMRGAKIGGTSQSGMDFCIRVIGEHHVGVLHEILNTLHQEGVDVIECRAEKTDEGVDMDTFIVQSRGKQKDFDDEKLEDMRHHLQELVGEDAQVAFEPTPKDDSTVGPLEHDEHHYDTHRMEVLADHTHKDLDAYLEHHKEWVEHHSHHSHHKKHHHDEHDGVSPAAARKRSASPDKSKDGKHSGGGLSGHLSGHLAHLVPHHLLHKKKENGTSTGAPGAASIADASSSDHADAMVGDVTITTEAPAPAGSSAV